jgi:N-acetylglucosaminyldiphosphoundecaprenol N-acetyl-beta-D-mannosaminyltransferase
VGYRADVRLVPAANGGVLRDVTVATYKVCSIPIAALGIEQAARTIIEAAASGGAFDVHLCNAYTLSLIDDDERLREALQRADLNLADGAPVAWLGRRHGTSGPVRGPSLVTEVCRAGRTNGLRHYFYGGAPGVPEAMAATLAREVPGLALAGYESPPFGEPSDAELVNLAGRLDAAGAHLVWVGLGTPRQDYVVPRLADITRRTVIPVGAAFDFLAGTVRQAPPVLQRTGFEWTYRLAVEPRRLWRRYLLGNPRFVARSLRHHLTA